MFTSISEVQRGLLKAQAVLLSVLLAFVLAVAAPLAAFAQNDASEPKGDKTMTFYYVEVVYYDDPTFDDPSCLRLLQTQTVEGLNVGDVLDTWDYVLDIEEHLFCDAYPAKPVVHEDESRNTVEVKYVKTYDKELTVNYFNLKAPEGSSDLMSPDATLEKMESVQFENLRFDMEVTAEEHAVEIADMTYVGSYPASLRLKSDPEDNVLNLVYTDAEGALAQLPSDFLVEDALDIPPAVDSDPEEGGPPSLPGQDELPDDAIVGGGAPSEDPGVTGSGNAAGEIADGDDVAGPQQVTEPLRPIKVTEPLTKEKKTDRIGGDLAKTGDWMGLVGLAAMLAAVASIIVIAIISRVQKLGRRS